MMGLLYLSIGIDKSQLYGTLQQYSLITETSQPYLQPIQQTNQCQGNQTAFRQPQSRIFDVIYQPSVLSFQFEGTFHEYLRASTLVGLTQENPLLDPLAVLHLDNRLCITTFWGLSSISKVMQVYLVLILLPSATSCSQPLLLSKERCPPFFPYVTTSFLNGQFPKQKICKGF